MTPQERLNWAVLYALREGCFFQVRQPKTNAPVQAWVQWGAMRYLHDAIADFDFDELVAERAAKTSGAA